jgi:hypothetical protein
MVLATAVGLVFFFFTMFQCSPVDFFWNLKQPGAEGTCINKDTLIGIAYLYSVGAAVTDLTIGLLPVALIWNLRMNRRTKGAIAGILGIGCMFVSAIPIFTVQDHFANFVLVRVLRLLFAFRSFIITRTRNSCVCITNLYPDG